MQPEVLPEKTFGTEAHKCIRDSSVHNADFSELVRLHWEQVFRTCLCIVRNHHDAEDAAQDCFLRAFLHLDQFQGEAQFSTWLHSIARNCSLMLLRRRRNRPEVKVENWPDSNGDLALFDPPDCRPDQLRCVLCAESLGRLVKSIAALPTTLRATADLIILNERPLQEVGQILDVSNAAVKSRLFRARNRLKRASEGRSVIKGEPR
jgi:RNA polymerase sigma-70 factor, ECF subfamily